LLAPRDLFRSRLLWLALGRAARALLAQARAKVRAAPALLPRTRAMIRAAPALLPPTRAKVRAAMARRALAFQARRLAGCLPRLFRGSGQWRDADRTAEQ